MKIIRKIDFFGGAHGNFLELVVNHAIDQNPYDITKLQFDERGACHKKLFDKNYCPVTLARQYSQFNIKLNDDDLVIRIVLEPKDMLIAIINSFLRSGDQMYDINDLEKNTFEKLSTLPKAKDFLEMLIDDHGIQKQYSRSVLRKYFFSMFDEYKHGLGLFLNWQPTVHYHNFPFSSLFNIDYFFESLQKIADFVNLEFVPTWQLANLHSEFLKVNQGLSSKIRCNQVMHAIIHSEPTPLNLNIIEEAWINYRISRDFNLHEVPCLETDNYPYNTSIISSVCYREKKSW